MPKLKNLNATYVFQTFFENPALEYQLSIFFHWQGVAPDIFWSLRRSSDWQSVARQAEKGILSLANSSIIQTFVPSYELSSDVLRRTLKRHPVHQTEQYYRVVHFPNWTSPFCFVLCQNPSHWISDEKQTCKTRKNHNGWKISKKSRTILGIFELVN